jgi:hypothetical protein
VGIALPIKSAEFVPKTTIDEKMFCTKREDNKLCDKKAGQQVKLI